MPDANDLNNLIKKTAMDAISSSKPVAVVFGKVLSTSPLQVKVEQKFTLSSKFLVKTSSCKDIRVNDEVILLRMQGGQKFIVIDKVIKWYLTTQF